MSQSDPYNNKVTYDEKWKTAENQAALNELRKRYFHRSMCAPDCPLAWAPEVLELLNTINKELGIQFNESSMGGYHISPITPSYIFLTPLKNAFTAFKIRFIQIHDPDSHQFKKFKDMSNFALLQEVVESALHPIKYSLNAMRIKYINPYLNKILKPKVHLSQIKEKYGELTIYFSCPDAYEKYIEDLIRKTEIKLSIKGAYWPLESLYDCGVGYCVGTDYHPDTIETRIDDSGTVHVKKTTYRNLMKELEVDINDLKLKVEAAKKAKQAAENGVQNTP